MTRHVRNLSLPVATFAAGCAVFGLTMPSQAQSAREAVHQRIVEAIKASGATDVKVGRIEGDDARFTVSSTTITTKDGDKTGTLEFGPTTYVDAKTTADGGYTIGEMTSEAMKFRTSDGKFVAEKLRVVNYAGQAPSKIKAGDVTGEKFERIEVSGITVTSDDGKIVPIASVAITAGDYVGNTARKGSLSVTGIAVPIDAKDPEMAQIVALGYSKMSLDFSMTGSWDDKTGRLDLTDLTMRGAEMGALKFTATIGGLTPEVMAQLQKSTGSDEKQIELLQGLTVEKVALRYDDASLATRLIDQQAKEQGVDGKTYAKQLKMMVPMMVSMIGNKDFEKKVVSAAGAFLDAPKSLTISAMPKSPLPVSQIMGAAMMAPQSLPSVLGAEVKAND
ncbi:MAG: hypothetical protein ABTQ29_09365 [Siculibacillus sp.]